MPVRLNFLGLEFFCCSFCRKQNCLQATNTSVLIFAGRAEIVRMITTKRGYPKVQMFNSFCKFLSRLTHLPEDFLRFLIIGTINTGFAYGLYALFIFMGLHYTLAVLCSTVIGIFFSFKTFGKWVFFNADNGRIFRFFAVYGVCYLVNIGLLKALTSCGVSNLYAAGLISSFLVAMCSFFLNKYFVFKRF